MTTYRKYTVYVNDNDNTMTAGRIERLLNAASDYPVVVDREYEHVLPEEVQG